MKPLEDFARKVEISDEEWEKMCKKWNKKAEKIRKEYRRKAAQSRQDAKNIIIY